ncbi:MULTISPECIES: hypothetical protein [unclassified Nocardioides]|uniref:hypothetical protein n=1 Tax=unclassified Nocardioides TaxID=2615069 RepID=UPI0009F016E6|nr:MULTISPECIES: hypothetical protein [unclassified Nocardioides]GAW49644.1 uncharacterized protein PD653B2_1971 [Nocardioides sp. PD653-B2]GAW56616.1 uncharacterized protein PD653_4053 [Nocardioides sp. PD653]
MTAWLLSLWLSLCAPAAPPPEVEAAAILHAWDDRRAQAWADGDVDALGDLYTAGSPTGRADRSMLRSWRDRGLRVEGLETQLLAVRVRDRSGDRLALVVTDRLAGGTAVGVGVRVPLPRDEPSTRRVVLRRVAGEWRVRSVV